MSFVRRINVVRKTNLLFSKVFICFAEQTTYEQEIMKNHLLNSQSDMIAPKKKIFALKGENKTIILPIDEVVYLESNGSYTKLYCIDGKQKMVTATLASTLRQIEYNLCDSFIRINRSVAVNYHYIQFLNGNVLTVQNQDFNIGRKYKQDFLDQCIFLRKQ